MKKTLKIFLMMLIAAMLAGCSGSKYVNDGTNVYHSYWTFSFGNVRHPLPNVDAGSFKREKSWLGRDKNHVYYEDKIVEGADPATIKAEKKPLCSDSKDYYYKGIALHVVDMLSFKILRLDNYHLWAKDNRNVYFDSISIKGADPSTYIILKNGYSKDRFHVWYYGMSIEGADAATFQTIGNDGAAADKFARYEKGKRVWL